MPKWCVGVQAESGRREGVDVCSGAITNYALLQRPSCLSDPPYRASCKTEFRGAFLANPTPGAVLLLLPPFHTSSANLVAYSLTRPLVLLSCTCIRRSEPSWTSETLLPGPCDDRRPAVMAGSRLHKVRKQDDQLCAAAQSAGVRALFAAVLM